MDILRPWLNCSLTIFVGILPTVTPQSHPTTLTMGGVSLGVSSCLRTSASACPPWCAPFAMATSLTRPWRLVTSCIMRSTSPVACVAQVWQVQEWQHTQNMRSYIAMMTTCSSLCLFVLNAMITSLRYIQVIFGWLLKKWIKVEQKCFLSNMFHLAKDFLTNVFFI